MSSLPVASAQESSVASIRFSQSQLALAASILSVFSLLSILFTVFSLWIWWTGDGLNSIGMIVAPISFFLLLRVWRQLGWEMDGTWWGLAILLLTVVVVRIREQSLFLLVLTPHVSTTIPPAALVVFAYGSGLVLLFGGTRLYRAALFPILLLWLVNPVPHAFQLMVDLPLQHVSAHLARAFAMALGQKLTPDNLRLMFTPEFGMFIAPGCNGIRGAVTMGLIALVAGYLYRFRWHAHALFVAGAVLLGYLFNFIRLCTLVLYYLVALHISWLQSRAEMGDYIIGAILFLIATMLLFYFVDRLKGPEQPQPAVDAVQPASPAPAAIYLKLAALLVLGIYGLIGFPRVFAQVRPDLIQPTVASADIFPPSLGQYHLVRTWNETLVTGQIVYVWAQYAPPDGGTPIDLGISPLLGPHDVFNCHEDRGEDPLWQNDLTFATAGNLPVDFNSAFYLTSASQYLEASTLCTDGGCGESRTSNTRFGIIYSRPDAATVLSPGSHRPIPILLRAESIDTAVPADTERDLLTASMRAFLSSVNLDKLTRPYRH